MSRCIVWANIIVQTCFPLACAFTPVLAVSADKPVSIQSEGSGPDFTRTRPYTLRAGETVSTVAAHYHLSIPALKKLNQFRIFTRPFEQLSTGDELDVPAITGRHDDSMPGATAQKQDDGVAAWLADRATQVAQATSGPNHARAGDVAISQAHSEVMSVGNTAAQQWLSQFGTARVQLGMDDHGKLSESAVDMLVPLYDNKNNMLFTQVGARHKDDRNTLNMGMGVRLFRGDWMYGVNTFMDNDITGHNRRLGLGAEAWTDNLKLSANSYFGLTDWHQSRDFDDYDERPANGFDLTALTYLPSLPQLGAKVKYEQYQGSDVALISKDTRQRNPKAVTLGLNYTPVPLITLGSDYRRSGSHDDLQINAQFTYNFGLSWAEQTSAAGVAFARSLAGSRTDLVERNNDIVLDYRKQEMVKLSLPAETRGQAGSQVPLNVQVVAQYGVDHIEWQAPEFFAAGGKIIATGPQTQLIQLPAWRATGNRYPVHAVAWDVKGHSSRTASGDILVEGAGVNVQANSTVTVDNTTYTSGSDITVTVNLKDAGNNPVTGAVAFLSGTTVVVGNATLKTGSSWTDAGNGSYTAIYTAGSAGTGLKASLKLSGWTAPAESADYEITSLIAMTGTIDVLKGLNKVVSHQFAATIGFPMTGGIGAVFAFNANNFGGKRATDFNWTADQSWVTVDVNGQVSFTGDATSATKTVIIRATPKIGGASLTYTFTIDKWFKDEGAHSWSDSDNLCRSQGSNVRLPNTADVTSGQNVHAIGTFWGEWGTIATGSLRMWVLDNSGSDSLSSIDGSVGWVIGSYMSTVCMHNL